MPNLCLLPNVDFLHHGPSPVDQPFRDYRPRYPAGFSLRDLAPLPDATLKAQPATGGAATQLPPGAHSRDWGKSDDIRHTNNALFRRPETTDGNP
ncbi:MAG: hypothetical protein JZU52_12560 [Lamprocystis purpurea]|jgi:hypothetical protein|uniref:hypothetical protein n=1 Tax=Lamprocystis purpurea TaxID=61598 RepID=UPI00035FD78A|nr:hypothetical protein [Lamprocystis purpurea]MBV5274427.1 hypothetical protein [Lamprocystis purpurea]